HHRAHDEAARVAGAVGMTATALVAHLEDGAGPARGDAGVDEIARHELLARHAVEQPAAPREPRLHAQRPLLAPELGREREQPETRAEPLAGLHAVRIGDALAEHL